MIHPRHLGHSLLLIGMTLALGSTAHSDEEVTSPPPAVREALTLSSFYRKHVSVGPFSIVASDRVSDFALLEAAYLIDRMIGHRPELLRAMAANKTRFAVMAPDEWTTRIPEHSDLRPRQYWDRRARGLGATRQRPAVSCGEENLLEYPGDPYSTENILIHEFAHAIHEMGLSTVDPTFDDRLRATYDAAMKKELWKDKYAATNHHEYWAEAVQSWFDTNRENDSDHNHVDTRAELIEYDPPVAALVREVFSDGDWRYVKPSQRVERAHLAKYDPSSARRFRWPPAMDAAYREHQKKREAYKRRSGESELDWQHRIAEAGDTTAQVTLGWRYREGAGVEQSDKTAVEWYRRAAEADDPAGQDSLGWMLKRARGVPRDDVEATRLFRRAADTGHQQAMYNLALMLLDGRGTARDPIAAYAWLHLAAERGHGWATGKRTELDDELDSASIAKAVARATAWKPREPNDAVPKKKTAPRRPAPN